MGCVKGEDPETKAEDLRRVFHLRFGHLRFQHTHTAGLKTKTQKRRPCLYTAVHNARLTQVIPGYGADYQ